MYASGLQSAVADADITYKQHEGQKKIASSYRSLLRYNKQEVIIVGDECTNKAVRGRLMETDQLGQQKLHQQVHRDQGQKLSLGHPTEGESHSTQKTLNRGRRRRTKVLQQQPNEEKLTQEHSQMQKYQSRQQTQVDQHETKLHHEDCTERSSDQKRQRKQQRKVLQREQEPQQPPTSEHKLDRTKTGSPMSLTHARSTNSWQHPQQSQVSRREGMNKNWRENDGEGYITGSSNNWRENSASKQRTPIERTHERQNTMQCIDRRSSMIQNPKGSPAMKCEDPSLVSTFDGLRLNASKVVLDDYNSDINAQIGSGGCDITTLNSPPGFRLLWAGSKANFGVRKGKVFFEVKIVEHLRSDCQGFSNEPHPNIARIGWSSEHSSLDLGEEQMSFGYGSSRMFSTDHKYRVYGEHFTVTDVIGALLDLDSRPATISFMKNGRHLGIAAALSTDCFSDKQNVIMYPHVFLKNCRIIINFGQHQDWFTPPRGFQYIGRLPSADRVGGFKPPARKDQCEVIMIVGLPGAGKTTWATAQRNQYPGKRYNILGTDLLLERMKVTDMPTYRDRFDHLYPHAEECFKKIMKIASTKLRNYILDQTNVFDTARKKKMMAFAGFYKIAAVIQPSDRELERRSRERTEMFGKKIPKGALREMKANYSLPESSIFDAINYIELNEREAQTLVTRYNTCRR